MSLSTQVSPTTFECTFLFSKKFHFCVHHSLVTWYAQPHRTQLCSSNNYCSIDVQIHGNLEKNHANSLRNMQLKCLNRFPNAIKLNLLFPDFLSVWLLYMCIRFFPIFLPKLLIYSDQKAIYASTRKSEKFMSTREWWYLRLPSAISALIK